jgi:hypothetical protein
MTISDVAADIRATVNLIRLHTGDPGPDGRDHILSGVSQPLFWNDWAGTRLDPTFPTPAPAGVATTLLPSQFDRLTPSATVTHISLWTDALTHYGNGEITDDTTVGATGLFQLTEVSVTVAEIDGGAYSKVFTAVGRSEWTVEVMEVSGTVNFFDSDTATAPYPYLFSQNGHPGISPYFGGTWGLALDPDPISHPRAVLYSWVKYTASGNLPPAFSMADSVAEGKTQLMAMINHLRGRFFLAGASQGAQVCDEAYKELRTGSLTHRKKDLLGVFAYGNPRRADGHTFPGGLDPGGHGVEVLNLQDDPEDLWWDFARPLDGITSMRASNGSQFAMTVFAQANNQALGTIYETSFPGLDFSSWPVALPNVFEVLALLLNTLVGHAYFDYFAPGVGWRPLINTTGDTRGCVTIARDRIWEVIEPPPLRPNTTTKTLAKVGSKWQEFE